MVSTCLQRLQSTDIVHICLNSIYDCSMFTGQHASHWRYRADRKRLSRGQWGYLSLLKNLYVLCLHKKVSSPKTHKVISFHLFRAVTRHADSWVFVQRFWDIRKHVPPADAILLKALKSYVWKTQQWHLLLQTVSQLLRIIHRHCCQQFSLGPSLQ